MVLCLNQIWRGARLVEKKRVEWLDDISIRRAECIEATATKEEQPIEVHTWAGVSDTSNDDIHISTYS